jgi:hypothetical protein
MQTLHNIIKQCAIIHVGFLDVGYLLTKSLLGAGWGILPTLGWVGSCLPTYLPSFLLSSREKISQQESNHQSLHSEMGTSPLSPGSLGSPWTIVLYT